MSEKTPCMSFQHNSTAEHRILYTFPMPASIKDELKGTYSICMHSSDKRKKSTNCLQLEKAMGGSAHLFWTAAPFSPPLKAIRDKYIYT